MDSKWYCRRLEQLIRDNALAEIVNLSFMVKEDSDDFVIIAQKRRDLIAKDNSEHRESKNNRQKTKDYYKQLKKGEPGGYDKDGNRYTVKLSITSELKTQGFSRQIFMKFQLWCDNCFNVLPEIPTGSVDLIISDLPYQKTACSWDVALPLDKLWKEFLRIGKRNTAFLFTSVLSFGWQIIASRPELFRYELIWEKPNGTNPLLIKKRPFNVHENILIFYKYQPTYNPQMTYGHSTYSDFEDNNKFIGEVYTGDKKNLISKHKKNTDGSRYPRSVQKFPQDRSGHPTKKPVELMSWLIKTYSNPNDIILDPTMGEGSCGVAAMQEDRRFIGIELNEKYHFRAVKDITKACKDTNFLL